MLPAKTKLAYTYILYQMRCKDKKVKLFVLYLLDSILIICYMV